MACGEAVSPAASNATQADGAASALAEPRVNQSASVPGPESGGTANPNNKPLPLTYFEDYGVNPFVDADEDPLSTFALDGDTASYALGRRYLRDGWLPPPEAVRIEEYVNAFEGGYSPAAEGLSLHLDAARAPFAPEGYVLLRVGVAAPALPLEREPVSLIFIVDISGSMDYDNRLAAAKRIMLGLLDQAGSADRAALVVYGSTAEVIVPLQATEDAPQWEWAIQRLQTGGATNAEAGIRLGYDIAADDMMRGQRVRMVLFSDGVGNVGETGPDQILEVVDQAAQRQATLTTVGVGISGNYNDVMMERLANRGNGTYHYIEDREAEDTFLAGPAEAVFHETARDARIQVEFDPQTVRKYRLLGYENRTKADESFRDDSQDFGEMGFRSDVTALYEVRPLGDGTQGTMATARPLLPPPGRGRGMGRTAGQVVLRAMRQHRGGFGSTTARMGPGRQAIGEFHQALGTPVRTVLRDVEPGLWGSRANGLRSHWRMAANMTQPWQLLHSNLILPLNPGPAERCPGSGPD